MFHVQFDRARAAEQTDAAAQTLWRSEAAIGAVILLIAVAQIIAGVVGIPAGELVDVAGFALKVAAVVLILAFAATAASAHLEAHRARSQ